LRPVVTRRRSGGCGVTGRTSGWARRVALGELWAWSSVSPIALGLAEPPRSLNPPPLPELLPRRG
jgi:hypothetical protein